MKRSNYLTPQQQKWGLFILLTGTLGFNLSMNPDHFNNIARNEVRLHSVDMATTSETAKPAEPAKETARPPGEEKKKSQELLVSGSKGAFKARVFEVENSTFATFEAIGNTEGRTCDLCGAKAIPLSSSIDKLADLNTELLALVNGKGETVRPNATEDKKPAQKKGEVTEIDLEKWAEKCDKASEETKLSCHKDRLIELSKTLKNSPETEGLIRDYFATHLQNDLKKALYGRTIKEMSASNCEGSVVYTSSYGKVGCMTDALDAANEISDEILSGLRAGNSKLVVQALTKMRAGSFSAQVRNSQVLAVEGKNENNMAKFQLGFRGMDPNSQQWILNQMSSNMFDSISQMQGTAAQKSILESLVEKNFANPVNSLLNEMKNFVMNGTPGNPNSSRNLVDFQVPSLADDRGVPPNPQNPNYTPGTPGNVPNSALASRLSAPVRGGGQQPGSVWLPGQHNSFLNNQMPMVPNGRVANQIPAPGFNNNQMMIPGQNNMMIPGQNNQMIPQGRGGFAR